MSTLIYPSPTVVVGVGRFGLATLERLAEDWQRLSLSSDDPSVKNLRLLHVRPSDDGSDVRWRAHESQFVDIAKYTGDGDLPSLALDMVILRSLGLIRYRDGTYQVAVPVDGGLVEKDGKGTVVRRRYFDWMALHPDPIASVERLERLAERRGSLGLFIRPLINRVRQGHSPRILLRCISRMRALAEGRDPSPWSWFIGAMRNTDVQEHREKFQVHFKENWVTRDDLRGLLEGFAPEPVPGWADWYKRTHHDWVHEPDMSQVPFSTSGVFDIMIPKPFVPTTRDLPSPLEPNQLLKVDWETNGWATEMQDHADVVEFTPVDASMYRLGLFDYDASSRVHHDAQEDFRARLGELGLHAHRGMVRLWVDLQRNRVEEQEFSSLEVRRRDGIDEALRQSLEVLGELLVRPLLNDGSVDVDESAFPEPRVDDWVDGGDLPGGSSDFMEGLEIERRGEDNQVRNALTNRLIELGFTAGEADVRAKPLFREISLTPDDVLSHPGLLDEDDVPLDPRAGLPGLLEFRQVLNDETRHLFNFGHLARYRHRPTRRPPRLTIYVVGDVGEPFVRASMRPLLREIHAELLRAYAPIFENFREGFDRSLSVTPLLWMPHPSDAFGGLHPMMNRCEEAAIIESIQGIRRWVETVPRGTRCIPQVIINSRVTDNAVLSQRDAVRQTRDFMNFQMRNDLSRERWLRQTVVGPSGDDFFSSFSCHEIEFPAERAREYLANRLARDLIRQIKRGEPRELPEVDTEPLEPPELQALVRQPTGRTRKQTRHAADGIGESVEERVKVIPEITAARLAKRFGEDFEEDLLRQVYAKWRELTRARGEMDGMMDGLRRETSEHLGQTLTTVRRTGDVLIDQHASDGGLKAAQAGFNTLERSTREHLLAAEAQRERSEGLCRKHRIPQVAPIGSAREALVTETERKPDLYAMRFGLLVWALAAPALGAPVCYLIATATRLYEQPNPLEFALGPLGPLLGAVLLVVPVWLALRRHMNQVIQGIQEKIEALAETARQVVEGSGSSFGGSPSIRSFIEARLHLTAALASRNYALRVHDRVVQDAQLAHRLSRSIDIQEDTLGRRAEDLGVRAQMAGVGAGTEADDVSHLFSTRDGHMRDSLVDPRHLKTYYERRYGEEKELQAMVASFIEQVGGFSEWRKHACMSDTRRILEYTRHGFRAVVERPVAEQYTFADQVGASLEAFVAKHYSNVGFGAKFSGYEGLDPDGVRVLCDTALVLHPALKSTYEEARQRPGAKPFTETLDIVETQIIPHSAYMLSFAQGIRPHSLRNLMRFESYHDRVQLPDDRTFPMSGERTGFDPISHPINHLTGFDGLRSDLNARILELSRERTRALADLDGLSSGFRSADAIVEAARREGAADDEPSIGLVDLRELIPLELLTPRNLGLEDDA